MTQMRKHFNEPILILAALLLALIVARAHDASATPTEKTYTLFASGDTMVARWVPYVVHKKGADWPLAELQTLIKNADIAMTNLECVIATKGRFWDKGERRPYLYRGRPEMLDVLTEVGIDVAVVANNHAMDFGPEALLEQLAFLDAAGIAQVGGGRNMAEASQPTYVQVGSTIVSFIGLETEFPKFSATSDSPGIHHARGKKAIIEALKKPIATARKYSDLVVFTPHWGLNWTENPLPETIEIAREVIDLGADAVLGHSAHHLHGIEIYKGQPIVYDMGSLLFDAVGKKRMRYSAAFVLDFTAQGFTKLAVHPVLLKSHRATRASGGNLERIHDIVLTQSKKLDPDIEFKREGDTLAVSFSPQNEWPTRKEMPPVLHQTGQTRRLPDELRNRETNVVRNEPPEWTSTFQPVALERGITVLGARNARAVWPRRAFVAEVALRVPGPMNDGRWEASIKGVKRGGDESFVWRHPIADATWLPHKWKKDQIVIDSTLVRPPRLSEGIYDLFYRFENLSKKTVLQPINATADADGYIPIGKIRITRKGIPSGPAGVAWHGQISPSLEPVVERSAVSDDGVPRRFIVLLVLGIVACVPIAMRIWRRKRGSRNVRAR
ncbi:MAG: CapA family protein [Myxococcota bacterium]|nr:CapA family protein [Myxococcota bacterium]